MDRWQEDSENKYFAGCMEKFKARCIDRKTFRSLTKGSHGHYGFDLGKTRDLSGVGYVTKLDDGRYAIAIHGFMPQNRAVEHEHSDRIPYLSWAKDGYVTLTPGDVTDNRYVEKWIYDCESERSWKIDEVDYDGHNANDMAIRIAEKLNSEDKVVEIPQTCAGLNLATKTLRDMVLADEEKIVFEYSPLLTWCLGNAIEVINNFGDIKLSKKHKDDTQRIDPVAAALNALARRLVIDINTPNVSDIIKRRGYALG